MTKKYKNNKNVGNSNWWQPSKIEKIMLWLTVATVLVSVVSQASSIVNNLLQFDSIYKQLYPLLNVFHLYVLFYIISNLRNIKQLIPEPTLSKKKNKNYFNFRENLKQWIKSHFGEIYWKEWKEEDNDSNRKKRKKRKKINEYIDNLTKNTNKSIHKTHTYFMGVFGCFVLLYVFELINSFTYSVNEPILHILTMVFNNIATLFWFYIYLTFNGTETTIKIGQKNIFKDEKGEIKKIELDGESYRCSYALNRWVHNRWRCLTFANMFNRPPKYELYEKEKEVCNEYPEYIKKYDTIEISKTINWKSVSWILLIASIGFFIYFACKFKYNEILEIELLKDHTKYKALYYWFRVVSTISILLGGCAMLAAFSRLSSGFKKVPLAAFLIMIFYAALQPLFFAGSEFSSSNMKIGQLLFIANALCLLGKFGLLHLIKWFFADYHIAYYFIAGKIVKDKSKVLSDINDEYYLGKLFDTDKENTNNAR